MFGRNARKKKERKKERNIERKKMGDFYIVQEEIQKNKNVGDFCIAQEEIQTKKNVGDFYIVQGLIPLEPVYIILTFEIKYSWLEISRKIIFFYL